VRLANQTLGHDEERLSLRQIDAGLVRDGVGAARDRVSGAAPLGVPVGGLQLCFLGGGDEIAAFLLQPGQERVVDARVDQQVAVLVY
jgi:hypothetical protein